MTTATQALDIQLSIYETMQNRQWSGYMQSFITDIQAKGFVGPVDKRGGVAPGSGEQWVAQERATLKTALTFHVAKEMVPLVQFAASQLIGTETFRRDSMPAEVGFLVFEDGMPFQELRGRNMQLKALSWRIGQVHYAGAALPPEPGLHLTWYSDLTDMRDEIAAELALTPELESVSRAMGNYQVAALDVFAFRQRIGPPVTDQTNMSDAQRALIAEADASNGDPRWMTPIAPTSGNNTATLYALVQLLGQTITDVREDSEHPRARQKAWKRAGLPGRVTVVRLRRRTDSEQNVSDVEWQHQWIVRGHWAWRACGENHPFAEPYEKGWHCKVWISEHLKGPEDRPLVVNPKVYTLVR